jgi:hypothetical protein
MVVTPGIIRNQQVPGSNPAGGSKKSKKIKGLLERGGRCMDHLRFVSPPGKLF